MDKLTRTMIQALAFVIVALLILLLAITAMAWPLAGCRAQSGQWLPHGACIDQEP